MHLPNQNLTTIRFKQLFVCHFFTYAISYYKLNSLLIITAFSLQFWKNTHKVALDIKSVKDAIETKLNYEHTQHKKASVAAQVNPTANDEDAND